jgi:type 1 glutamine amidotransferase
LVGAAAGTIAASAARAAGPAEKTRVLIVVGPSSHPPGTHEVAAGGRLMKGVLDAATDPAGFEAEVVEGWPAAEQWARAATVVFIGDLFPPNRLPEPAKKLDELKAVMARGVGIACVHYATGLLGEHVTAQGEHPLLEWIGGYFANRSCPHHQSVARVFQHATIEPAAVDHEITRGWSAFTVHDEPYINNYFGGEGNSLRAGVTAVATAQLPPESPRRETVAWCIERGDSGRGFGVVMPHFYRNWSDDSLRTLILNGIVWTAKRTVPARGVSTAKPDLAAYGPAAVTPTR